MKRLLFVILLTIMGCCGVHVQAVGYEKIINPVLPGDRPDPTVIEINGEYWAAATSNEWSPLFPIFKSKDLVNWELVNYVFPDGAPDWALNNFWAPELSYDEKQGKVYLYYTARDKRTKRLSCAAAVADPRWGGSKIWDRWLLRNQALLMLLLQEMRRVNFILYGKKTATVWACLQIFGHRR